jgi:hypothetical protein
MNPILVSTNVKDEKFWFDSDQSLKFTVGKHNVLWLTKSGKWVGRVPDGRVFVCEKSVAILLVEEWCNELLKSTVSNAYPLQIESIDRIIKIICDGEC